jgi:hypothetical protein
MDEQLCYKDECPICLDALNNDIKILTCKHTYHKICINTWLERTNICPMCRFPLDTEYNCRHRRHRFIKYNITINDNHMIFKNFIYTRKFDYKKIKQISHINKYFSLKYLDNNKIIEHNYSFKNEYICEQFFKTIKNKFYLIF